MNAVKPRLTVSALRLWGILLALLWFWSFWPAIESAAIIWAGNEIFNHGFLVIPIVAYLIYRQRHKIAELMDPVSYFAALIIVLLAALYVFGVAGDINVFRHFAVFMLLPAFLWFLIGDRAAWHIGFPLAFMIFAVPVGEELIPLLQEVTTDIAVPLIEMSGIPVFRSGLYLEIPNGRFLVAEACSGISFFIGSLVFGSLYGYLCFHSWKKRLLLGAIVVFLPIIANAIRVFGIVYVAHITDMEYAVGADHLVYGFVFYAFVLFLLLLIGEQFSDGIPEAPGASGRAQALPLSHRHLLMIVVAIGVSQAWQWSIRPHADATDMDKVERPQWQNLDEPHVWRPLFEGYNESVYGRLDDKTLGYWAYYLENKGELISLQHRLYSDENWSRLSLRTVELGENNPWQAHWLVLANADGQRRGVLYWYQVGEYRSASPGILKLYQAARRMVGLSASGSVMALSVPVEADADAALSQIKTRWLTPSVATIYESR